MALFTLAGLLALLLVAIQCWVASSALVSLIRLENRQGESTHEDRMALIRNLLLALFFLPVVAGALSKGLDYWLLMNTIAVGVSSVLGNIAAAVALGFCMNSLVKLDEDGRSFRYTRKDGADLLSVIPVLTGVATGCVLVMLWVAIQGFTPPLTFPVTAPVSD